MLPEINHFRKMSTTQQNALALAVAHGTPGQVAELLGKIEPGCFIDDVYHAQL